MLKLWVVVSNQSGRVYGPFDKEVDSITWARANNWPKGFMTRVIEPIS